LSWSIALVALCSAPRTTRCVLLRSTVLIPRRWLTPA
jgi:hypothetical protein